MVNLIDDLRKEGKNPEMAVSIPVSGFDGWAQTNPRRLGIINAQFGACNVTRHPGQHHCVSEETRGYWRQFENSPVNQGYHCTRADSNPPFLRLGQCDSGTVSYSPSLRPGLVAGWHNAESYFLIGQAMGTGMVKAMAGEVSAILDRFSS